MGRKKAPLGNWDQIVGPDHSRSMDFSVKAYLEETTTYEEYIEEKYQDVQDKYGVEFARPVETRAAPTTNPTRPRALQLAYMKDTETLLIQFRDAPYICEYPDVPIEIWQDLKVTDSTGKYLRNSGLDQAAYKKVPKAQFPEEIRVLFTQ